MIRKCLKCFFLDVIFWNVNIFFFVWLDLEIGSEYDKNELFVSVVFFDEEMLELKKVKNRIRNFFSVLNDSGIVELE